MTTNQQHIALFDFDKTLVDCNSANLWFRSELRAGRLPFTYALRIPWWTLQYRLGTRNLERMFEGAFELARGQAEAPMIENVRLWYDSEIRHRARPGALAALREHRAAGDRLVLATSSSQYIARLACESFGLDEFICTQLELADGYFTGKLAANAMGPQKAERVAEWAEAQGVDLTQCTFYTDSITDLALLKRVGHPVAVNPDQRLLRTARELGWPVLDWGTATRQGHA